MKMEENEHPEFSYLFLETIFIGLADKLSLIPVPTCYITSLSPERINVLHHGLINR
jgi:hypothetical protein